MELASSSSTPALLCELVASTASPVLASWNDSSSLDPVAESPEPKVTSSSGATRLKSEIPEPVGEGSPDPSCSESDEIV